MLPISEKSLYFSCLAITNQTFAVSNYTFETPEFGLSDEGLHLLRSGYNYKTLAYHDIRKATLKRAAAVRNGLLVLALGMGMLAFAVYQAITVYESFLDPNVHTISIESMVILVLPLLLGNYCIYVSLKKAPILLVRYQDGKAKLPLKTFVNTNQAYPLTSFLQEKLGSRFLLEDYEVMAPEATGFLESPFN